MICTSFIPLRHRREAGAWCGRGPQVTDHPRRRGRAGGRQAHRVAVRGVERRPADDAPPAGRGGRGFVASSGRGGAAGRLHRRLNVAAQATPSFSAATPPGRGCPYLGQINTADDQGRWQPAYDRARAGGCRIGSGPSSISTRPLIRASCPRDMHTMSVFAQYVPHKQFARGDWESRRDEVKRPGPHVRISFRFCGRDMPRRSWTVQVLGPPDIEREVGLVGGHIFQGECLPAPWDRRFTPRTPMPGVLPLRCLPLHPGRQRDRHQRAERGDGDLGGGE